MDRTMRFNLSHTLVLECWPGVILYLWVESLWKSLFLYGFVAMGIRVGDVTLRAMFTPNEYTYGMLLPMIQCVRSRHFRG